MFLRGSRYRSLPQSTNETASGDSLLGVDVRLIPRVDGQFLHTIADRERLDLLAFKYYGDANRWWLIADANRDRFEIPTDLVDPGPFVDEEVAVTHPELLTRTDRLLVNLAALGTAQLGTLGASGATTVDPFSTVVVVRYLAATTRPLILQELRSARWTLVGSVSWTEGADTVEAYSLTDAQVTRDWNELLAALGGLPGVRRAVSLAAGARLLLGYNTALTTRDALVAFIARRGFAIVPGDSRVLGRVGTRIVIPPNQAV